MRIAYLLVDPGIGVYGTKGASVHVQEVVRALRAEGHEVTVYCTRRDEHVPDDLADLRVVSHALPATDGTADRERAIAKNGHRLAALAAAEPYDLVLERYSLFSDAGAQLAEALAVPLVVEVNAPLVTEQRQHRDLVDETGAYGSTARLFARADLITCVSEPVASWVVDTVGSDRGVLVVPNGVNTDRIHPRRSPKGDDEPVTIGFVGTLKPWHGTDLLVRAVAGLPASLRDRVVVDVVGTGPEQSALEALAAELGLADRARFRGAVPPAEMPRVLQELDVAVAPYPPGEHYFSPLKVYEYLAAGLPVVSSAIGTLPEVLQHGRTGVLVAPGDVPALSAALAELVSRPDRRTELGRRARTSAVAEHDWRLRCRMILDAVARPVGVSS